MRAAHDPTQRPRLRRGTVIALAVLAAAVGGLLLGTHGTSRSSLERRDMLRARATNQRPSPGASAPDAAPPAVRWAELGATPRGPNADFVNALGSLAQTPIEPETLEGRPDRLSHALAQRAERRAFDGAPPTIPHAIDERSPSACLACHGEGLVVMERRASKISHPIHSQCTQCHVPSERTLPELASSPPLDSTFVPLRSTPGERFLPTAPPTVPHGTFMRSDCASCHGALGPPGLRTTHPERQSCRQCHATSNPLDQELGAR